jgi:hypothetical protein
MDRVLLYLHDHYFTLRNASPSWSLRRLIISLSLHNDDSSFVEKGNLKMENPKIFFIS